MSFEIVRRAKAETEESFRTFKRLNRICLSCKSTFDSAWAGERICTRCKGTTAWRTGASVSMTGSNQSQSRSGRKASS